MTNITITRDESLKVTGFTCIGHADYAEEGSDIVCAGISVLVINTINSIAMFTSDRFETDEDAEEGLIAFSFTAEPSDDAQLLLRSMVLGLQNIQNQYGNEYIQLIFEEV
jgi:hypothetical protein